MALRGFDRWLTALRLTRPAPKPATAGSAAAGGVLLELQNRHGSVEHYYHFVLGFMVPLLLRPQPPSGTSVVVRSCGPMDAHLVALGLPWLTIIPKQAWRELELGGGVEVDRVSGFDDQDCYDPDLFKRARTLVWQCTGISNSPPDHTVLLVNRGKCPDYYRSEAVEIETSADLRRTVPNMPELEAKFAQAGWPVRTVELETASLRDQVARFARTRILVAQHGAALVNMLWMAPGAAIIEINPLSPSEKFHSCFRLLAQACGHRYAAVTQTGPHSAVPAEAVLAAYHELQNTGAEEVDPITMASAHGQTRESRDGF